MSATGLTRWLDERRSTALPVFAVAAAFTAYFCMYGFRKPYAVAEYQGLALGPIDLKGALVISQVLGYALSKALGIKFNSEMPAGRRAAALIALIAAAEAALLLFAVVPPQFKIVAIFLNGLPLGAVWGLVFSFLEGRRTSDILGAGLSCSYIVASGAVKSVGAALLARGVSESWMPVATGLLFFPLFLLAVAALRLLPPPSQADVAERTERVPMDRHARRYFVHRYLPGVSMLVVVYVCLTGYREFRDQFAAELWRELGSSGAPEVFTLSELPIALSVMVALSLLYLVRDPRRGLIMTYVVMIAGSILVGASTILFDLGLLSPMMWMILVGLGLYLGYVPYGCILFDRTIAALGVAATAVFLIYVSDAFAYGGSVAIVLYKKLATPEMSMLTFFRYLSYGMSVVTTIFFATSAIYFLRRARQEQPA